MAAERRGGVTLTEALVAVLLLSVATTLALVALSTTANVLSVTEASARTHVDAERCLRLCLTEVRRARRDPDGSPATPAVSGTGLQAGDPDDSLELRLVAGVDPADPSLVLWGDRLRLTFEQDGAEVPGNGLDDDRDGRIDEGRVALYRVGTPDQLLAVAAHDVSRFEVEMVRPAPGTMRIGILVQVEQVIDRAVRGADVAAVAAGAGPRARYTARGSITLLN